MGWTSYNAKYYKKNGQVDRKKECDAIFLEGSNRGHYEILKSSMVGATYYAAVRTLMRFTGKDENGKYLYEPFPDPEKQPVWAAIVLTETNRKDFYNFSYKDLTEDAGPTECACPATILNLLSDTDNAYALNWRKRCMEHAENKKIKTRLNRFPVGSQIKFFNPFETVSTPKGASVLLTKVMRGSQKIWTDGTYRWTLDLIPADYRVMN
jgi:hypothetical protein